MVEIITIALNILLLVLIIFILYVNISNKYFHIYPCYVKLILSLSIFFDNALCLIELNNNDSTFENIICYSKAFLLSLFDKLIPFMLIINTLILYLGIIRRQYYSRNQKKIFYILLSIAIIVSSGFTLFNIKGISLSKKICTVPDNYQTKIIDFSIVSALLCFNIFCVLKILLYLLDKKNEITSNSSSNKKDYNHHFNIILLMLIIDGTYFIMSLMMISKNLTKTNEDLNLVYLGICLIVVIFYTINKNVIKEIIRIVQCKKKNNELFDRDLSSFSGLTDDSKDDDSSFNI